MSVTLSPSVRLVCLVPCLDYIACSNLYVPAPILSCYVMVDNYLKEHENYLDNDLHNSMLSQDLLPEGLVPRFSLCLDLCCSANIY